MNFSLYEPPHRESSGDGPPIDISIVGDTNRNLADRISEQIANAPEAADIDILIDSPGGAFFLLSTYLSKLIVTGPLAKPRG